MLCIMCAKWAKTFISGIEVVRIAVSLSIAVKNIEAQLTDYHKAVSDMLSRDQSSSSVPISATVDSSINPATVSPTSSTLSILDELADRNRRKKNIIVYNLPESAPSSKGDSEAFTALCSCVYNCACTVTKSVRMGNVLGEWTRQTHITFSLLPVTS